MMNYLWKDQNGDYVNKSKPIDYYYAWFWRPKYWKMYDDLHKNIRDQNKYKNINKELFVDIISKREELKNLVFENENFWDLQKLLPEPKKVEIVEPEKPKKINFIKRLLW